MKKSRVAKPLMMAKMTCIQSVIICGRQGPDIPDLCFKEGKDYLFCYDEKKNEAFTQNEVGEMHFLPLDSKFTQEDFNNVRIGTPDQFGLSEFETARYAKMFKMRHSYSEE